ncbi:MAG: chorismate-binding protein, partial [Alphaproteobacteria bacterium]|nr:chorismate-binding protein [Alphaproteobacteria bacterium]
SLKGEQVSFATGDIFHHSYLSDIPKLPEQSGKKNKLFSINLVPFSQIRERGFEVHDDGLPIISMDVKETLDFTKEEFFSLYDFDADIDVGESLQEGLTDEEFAELVDNVIKNEIREGEGANFLISRKFHGKVSEINPEDAMTIFSRLCKSEITPYMVFCFFDQEHFFIAASPERHLSIKDDIAYMNPICGTLPKKPETLKQDLTSFVQDEKEINELFMVVDETLKLMMPLCPSGGEIVGPYLREMRTLIHTENELKGKTDWNLVEAFRETMFAPTMIGSPLKSACRIIRKYENEGRRYYSSALMLLKHDENGKQELDSAITIRMVEFQKNGHFTVQAGASIVRDSIPRKEAIETRVKALGMLKAITTPETEERRLPGVYSPEIEKLMLARNDRLSPFWINKQSLNETPKELKGKSIFIINNEDDFVYMMAHLLEHMGASVKIKSIKNIGKGIDAARNFDMVIIGPGPGDPNDRQDPKMNKIRNIIEILRKGEGGQKFFGICLGHQVLCSELGLSVEKLPFPLQGVQKSVNIFGDKYELGFYNTFCPKIRPDFFSSSFSVAEDQEGFVFATRASDFGSIQGHPESILSKDGYRLLQNELSRLLFPEIQ